MSEDQQHPATAAVLSFSQMVQAMRADIAVLKAQRVQDETSMNRLGEKVEALTIEVHKMNTRQTIDEMPGIRITSNHIGAIVGVIGSVVGIVGLLLALFRG